MFKRFVTTFLFLHGLFLATTTWAQDRLITTNGDTILCKIQGVDGPHIMYSTDGDTTNRKWIPFEQVIGYEKDYRGEDIIVLEPIKPLEFAQSPIKRPARTRGFMLGFGMGYMYRLAEVPDSDPVVQEYIKKLKSGLAVRVEANYFFGRYFGMGAKYILSHSQARLTNAVFQLPNGSIRVGDLSENINMHTLIGHFTSRVSSTNDRFHFLPGLSAGYTSYHERAMVLDSPMIVTGGTFCIGVHLSMDFEVTRDLYVSTGVDYTSGVLNSIEIDDGTTAKVVTLQGDNREELTRFEFWAGLRYYFRSNPRPKKGYYD